VGARVGAFVLGGGGSGWVGGGMAMMNARGGAEGRRQVNLPTHRRLGVATVVGAGAGAGAGAVPPLQALPAPLYCACCVCMG
jgi:hypothetical protein